MVFSNEANNNTLPPIVLISLTSLIRFNPENNPRRQAEKVLLPFY